MSQKIVDYTLDTLTPANPDSSLPAVVSGCVLDTGPGATVLGNYPKALNFKGGGKLSAALPLPSLDARKFCLRVIFRADDPVTSRQDLLESNALPVAFYLAPGIGSSAFSLVASVKTRNYGVGKASSAYMLDLKLGVWYAADLVYDTDTLAVFVDNVIYSVHAFPDGAVPTEHEWALSASASSRARCVSFERAAIVMSFVHAFMPYSSLPQ